MRDSILLSRTVAAACLAIAANCGVAHAQEEATVKRQTQLRSQPSDSAPGIADLPVNSVLIRQPQRQGAWMQVKTSAGTSGWVSMFDIGTPVRDLVVGLLRRAVTKPSAGTLATATIGIRGLGQGNVASVGAGAANGPSGIETVALVENARASQEQARDFATRVGLRSLALDDLPVPPPPAGLPAEVLSVKSVIAGDGLLSRALRSPDSLTDAEEAELGRQFAVHWMQGQPADATPGMQAYVNRLGRWLSLQSSRPALTWTFVVVDEAEFQAFSAPGGYVFVSRGLVDRCVDEAELAALLAHEIAHVSQRHGLVAMQKFASADARATPDLAAMAWHMQRMGMGARAEFEADRLAVTMLARSGLDPFGLMAVLVQQNALNDSDLHYAEAHPQSRLRLDQLEQAISLGGSIPEAHRPQVTIGQRLASLGLP